MGKLIGNDISPYGITAWRFLIGGLLLLPFAVRERHTRSVALSAKAWIGFALSGILVVCISMLLLQFSIFYGKAVLAAVIVSTNTLYVAVFAFLFLKESISKLHAIGLLLGLLGLFLIIYGERVLLSQSTDIGLGVIFGIAAAVTFALYTVYSKKLVVQYGSLTTISFSFILGAIALFAYSWFTGQSVYFALDWKNITLLLYLSVFVTGIAYILYFEAIKQLGAAKASLYFFLKPAVAAVLAWLLHKEEVNFIQIFGIIVIMLSLSREAIIRFLSWNSLLRKA